MQVVVQPGDVLAIASDLMVVGVHADEVTETTIFKPLDRALGGALSAAMKDEDFQGKSEQKLVLPTGGKLKAKRVALIGLGKRKARGPLTIANLGGTATRLGNAFGAKSVLCVLPQGAHDETAIALATRGALLGAYRYDRFLSDKGRAPTVSKVMLSAGASKPSAATKSAIERAEVVSRAIAMARDLVNEPPIELYPESFAKRASAEARRRGLGVKVFTPEQLVKMNMNLLLAVGQGSAHGPRLVHLSYVPKGAKKSKEGPIVLVGKGITFDSGGLCLKPSDAMMDMKVDMGGAAAVLATMCAIAELRPGVEVHGILSLAENMPSGTAVRLGDVIRSASGRTVEVNNTDAEGRLVLADAIHYGRALAPSRMIDMATLTGACVVALGPYTVGLFSNDDAMAKEIAESAQAAGEDFWRMPLNHALKEQLKSDVADTKNTGERYGGAITAALFLSEFVGDVPWCHLDIAGPVTSKKEAGASSKGGTGVPVATLLEWLTR